MYKINLYVSRSGFVCNITYKYYHVNNSILFTLQGHWMSRIGHIGSTMSTTQPPLKKLKPTNRSEEPEKIEQNEGKPVGFGEWCCTNTENIQMPSGKYYCGDLSYVLNPNIYQEIMNEEGKSTLSDGRVVVCFFHEGCMPERWNDVNFNIRSGMIGITLLTGLEKQWVHPEAWEDEHRVFNLKATGTMMDYIKQVGTIVAYRTDFNCQKSTMSHYKNDDHSTTTTFGDNVSVFTLHGLCNS
jgi:hypothetical protein